MELRALVRLDKSTVRYSICQIRPGLYQAELARYAGDPASRPAKKLLLVRSPRQWVGSEGSSAVIAALGNAIDAAIAQAPIFRADREKEDFLEGSE
jgi:hypothetical protein